MAVSHPAMHDWYDAHAESYDQLEHGTPGDVEYYVSLAAACATPVLELGCGTGRVTIAIARAGVPVVGVDRSERMLAEARRKAAGIANVHFIQGDMRSFCLRERFGLICIPFRSFQHLLTPGDQRDTLARCVAHLAPGGTLALNVGNPPVRLTARRGRRGSQISTLLPGRPLRLIPPDEMAGLLRDADFTAAAFGGFDGAPLTEASTEQVWLARRPKPPLVAGAAR